MPDESQVSSDFGSVTAVPDGSIPVLTLWQPHASLVALLVKWIETRSWSTTYRGELGVAAAKKIVYGPIGGFRAETWFSDVQHVDNCYCDEGEVDFPCQRGATRTPCLTRLGSDPVMLPLGAIVATCTLDDVVPMVDQCDGGTTGSGQHLVVGKELELHAGYRQQSVEDQRPYGTFAPGRYAWLLSDIVALDKPIPFRGGQRLTKRWVPA